MTVVLRAFSAMILAVVAVAGVSSQTHHLVGEEDGWGPEMNATSWLAGRVFKVGDKLLFNRSNAVEGILEVRGPEEFQACDFKNPIKMYTDYVPLEEEGVRYFVSGNLEYCRKGLKLPVPIVTNFEPFWPGPPNPSPGFEPVKSDLAPPEPYWPAPGTFPPSEHEPPPPPEYDPPVKPSFPPPEYDPPVKPSFPPPPQEPSHSPPSRPSGGSMVEGSAMMMRMIVGLMIGWVVQV